MEDEGSGDVEADHEEGDHYEAESAPVGGVLAGAIGEEFLLTGLAAGGAFTCGAEEEAKGRPEGGLLVHFCGGRTVSLRKISSRLASPNSPQRAWSEPLATSLPSLMMTAWEQSRVT